jgi:formylglycine-generating enzyme
MLRHTITIFAVLLAFAVCGEAARGGTIDISLVTVGDPGNVPDPATGYGAVPYVYQIGEFDITVSQYCQFLNDVAKADPYGLYTPAMAPGPFNGFLTLGISQTGTSGNYSYSVAGSYNQAGNCPIFDVNWGDAARFANWLQNGQPNGPEGPGTTETGAYALNGGTSNMALMAVTRSPTASWVIPNLNEWYKASYYAGGGTNSSYWTYATQSNTTPSNVLSAIGTNNANFLILDNSPPNYGATDPINGLTPVGAFADSSSAYGTYDQNGNVEQWNETANGAFERGLRGGSYADGAGAMIADAYDDASPTTEGSNAGFRVAYVPEPSGVVLLAIGAMLLILYKILWTSKKGVNHAFAGRSHLISHL